MGIFFYFVYKSQNIYLLDGVLNRERLFSLGGVFATGVATTASQLTALATSTFLVFQVVAIPGRVSVAGGDPQKKAQCLGKSQRNLFITSAIIPSYSTMHLRENYATIFSSTRAVRYFLLQQFGSLGHNNKSLFRCSKALNTFLEGNGTVIQIPQPSNFLAMKRSLLNVITHTKYAVFSKNQFQ
jgi:hypothetical protein